MNQIEELSPVAAFQGMFGLGPQLSFPTHDENHLSMTCNI